METSMPRIIINIFRIPGQLEVLPRNLLVISKEGTENISRPFLVKMRKKLFSAAAFSVVIPDSSFTPLFWTLNGKILPIFIPVPQEFSAASSSIPLVSPVPSLLQSSVHVGIIYARHTEGNYNEGSQFCCNQKQSWNMSLPIHLSYLPLIPPWPPIALLSGWVGMQTKFSRWNKLEKFPPPPKYRAINETWNSKRENLLERHLSSLWRCYNSCNNNFPLFD